MYAKSMKRSTLKQKVTLIGVGLHSGTKVRCTLHPAPAHHGIVFIRSDLRSIPHIKADITKVTRTDLCTTLGTEGASVATVEHLMAACAGLGIDNAAVELSAGEVPIMDGSSREFVDAILEAGIRQLPAVRKVLRLKRAVSVRYGDKRI